MEASRRTISIGPVTISIRRGERDDVTRIGPIASPLVHVIVLILAVLLTSSRAQKQRTEEIAKAATPPVTVTFVTPFKPPAPPQPKVAPREQTFQMRKPPPPSQKKLLMQPAPDTIAAAKTPSKTEARRDAGRNDTRPAGGQAGGPEPRPLAGVPDPGSVGRDSDGEPADSPSVSADDLDARLRSFKRAIEEPRPPSPKGHKGGGAGTGGLTMPNMPETGFGVGNLEFEGHDYDWADYGRQIYWAILQAWYRRLLADSGVFERWAAETRIFELDHKSGVHFTILRSGQVIDIGVESASGCRPLDDSATEALQEVVLPRLPEDFKRDSETVHARFIAEGPIPGMRQTLQQLQAAGWF